jgi:hypothetical protein
MVAAGVLPPSSAELEARQNAHTPSQTAVSPLSPSALLLPSAIILRQKDLVGGGLWRRCALVVVGVVVLVGSPVSLRMAGWWGWCLSVHSWSSESILPTKNTHHHHHHHHHYHHNSHHNGALTCGARWISSFVYARSESKMHRFINFEVETLSRTGRTGLRAMYGLRATGSKLQNIPRIIP